MCLISTPVIANSRCSLILARHRSSVFSLQLKDAESAIKDKVIELLTHLKGFKIVATILVFKKIKSKDKTKCDNFYSSSKAEIIINESYIDDVFLSIYTTILENIQKSLGKCSAWIIESVIDHTVSISKYNSLTGSSYVKLPNKLDHPRKRLIRVWERGQRVGIIL